METSSAVQHLLLGYGRKWLWLTGLAIALNACAQSTPTETAEPVLVADSPTVDIPLPDTTIHTKASLNLDPLLPPKKSDDDLVALQSSWDNTLEEEHRLLMSSRLEGWIAGLADSTDEEGYPIRRRLTKQQFESLTTREKLAYQIFHPEEWLQNCAEYDNAAGFVQAIFRKLPFDESGVYWSERQMAALVKDSNEVKKVVLECLAQNKAASIPMMRTIAELKVKEAIPSLIDIYKAQTVKDDLILTTLMEIMERRNDWKWIYSPTCKAMVIADHNILPMQPATIDTILSFAQRHAMK